MNSHTIDTEMWGPEVNTRVEREEAFPHLGLSHGTKEADYVNGCR